MDNIVPTTLGIYVWLQVTDIQAQDIAQMSKKEPKKNQRQEIKPNKVLDENGFGDEERKVFIK